jgi:hypothetical protein
VHTHVPETENVPVQHSLAASSLAEGELREVSMGEREDNLAWIL